MAEVNQCDLYCPRKALAGAEYREELTGAGALKRFTMAAAVGVFGVQQVVRAAGCPARNNPPENWQPDRECVDVVQRSMLERPLDLGSLTDYERGVLGPIIGLNPPDAEG